MDLSTIYDGEADPFDQPVLDHKERKVTPPDLRKERQRALCEELLKPKYAVNGFKTSELQRTLSALFENPVISATFATKALNTSTQPYIPDTAIHFGRRIGTYQSGLEPDYKGFGGKYVTLQKRKFFSRFLETKHIETPDRC